MTELTWAMVLVWQVGVWVWMWTLGKERARLAEKVATLETLRGVVVSFVSARTGYQPPSDGVLDVVALAHKLQEVGFRLDDLEAKSSGCL